MALVALCEAGNFVHVYDFRVKKGRAAVVALARDAGLRAYHAGALANSAAAEALTSVLIFLNGRYRTTSGIRLTGLPDGPA